MRAGMSWRSVRIMPAMPDSWVVIYRLPSAPTSEPTRVFLAHEESAEEVARLVAREHDVAVTIEHHDDEGRVLERRTFY
jgi:hypothetical protein